MNYRFVIFSIAKLLQVLGLVLFLPMFIAISEIFPCSITQILSNPITSGFVYTILLSLVVGTILTFIPIGSLSGNLVKEGFSIVTFGWIVLAFFGSIPLVVWFVSQGFHNGNLLYCFSDAFFEIMSGFTTTGATIITDIEAVPKGIVFWRSLTHWLGGMGIVTLALSIFPTFGISAYQMFRGEVPGPTTERLKPRLHQTAAILWGVYAFFTLAETLLLKLGGMSFFDAVCHAFGTMATGGFSTKNSSVAAYNSSYIDWVIIIFMFFAGMNFILHYQIIFFRRFSVLRKDHEFRFYAWVIAIAIIIGTVTLSFKGLNSEDEVMRSFRNVAITQSCYDEKVEVETLKISSFYSRLRYVSFQVLSIVTTTGFCTADFDMWPSLLRMLLLGLMFFGGCAGSTGGGIKMARIMVVLKVARREIISMVKPRLISPIKIAGRSVEEKTVSNIIGFFTLFMLLTAFFTFIMSIIIPDFITAMTSVIATICNIGPGLSGVGATENYAWIPIPGKWVLSVCMLIGRLEIYTVLVALIPFSLRR